MAVSPRTMHVPAGLPIDELTRPEILDVGAANVANRNVRIDEVGSLCKRFGSESLTSDLLVLGGQRTTGRRIFGARDQPCVIDGTYLDAYSPGGDGWLRIGRVSPCSYRERALPTFSGQAILSDIEVTNGFMAAVVVDDTPGQVRMVVVDAESGTLVHPFTVLGSGGSYYGMVASFGNYFVAFIASPSAGSIDAYLFNTDSPSSGWTSLATVAASGAATIRPSVCSLSNRVAIVYGTTSGASRVSVKTYNASGLVESATITAGTTPVAVDCDASDLLWVAWGYGGNVYAKALGISSLATVTGTASAWEDYGGTLANMRVCAGTTAQTARAFVHDSAGPAANGNVDVAALTISAGAVSATAAGRVYNALPSSRPFCRDGRYYMTCNPSPTNTDADGGRQGLCVLVDWSSGVAASGVWYPVANIAPGLVPVASRAAKVVALDALGNTWAVPFQTIRRGDFANTGGGASIGCSFAEIDFVDRNRWQTATHHGVTQIGGGVLSVFDGVRLTETGFLSRPLKTSVTTGGTGLTGSFRWVAVYEDVDAFGNMTVSGISDPTDATSLTNQTATLSVPPLSVTARFGGSAEYAPRVAWYRTLTGGEPPYYRVGATAVDPTDDSITLADSTSDATLATRPKLYAPSLPGTVGEAQDRRAPPGLTHVVSYADMLVGAKGSSLFYSGQPVYGEATWFSPLFELPISGGDNITALAVQDGALVVFKRDRILVLSGEAPSDNGAAGGLGTPRIISSDVGCNNANSVVVTSLGIVFQSDRGIELFTRAQAVQWIGDRVQDTLAAYPDVTSAVVDVRNSLIRITLSNGLDSSGYVTQWNDEAGASLGGKDLIYDLAAGGWISIDDRTQSSVLNLAAQHAAYIDGRYHWLSSSGVVRRETDGWLDGAERIPSSFTAPPWKLGLQQDQRVYELMFLFERHSAAGLTIEVAEDYGAFAAITANKTWTEAAIASTAKVSFRPREHGHAVQFRVSDTAPATLGTGQGFTWIGFSADIAAKTGTTRGTPRIDTGLRR